MEKYYTFLCETYNGDKLEICVLANSEDHARERLSDYKVSKGELHYICKLLDVSEKGTEKYYHSNNNEAAKANYAYAMEHPDEYARFNVFTTWKHCYTEPAKGTCKCGNTVILENQYCGACQCDKCGQWYNIFGQELIDPEYWED